MTPTAARTQSTNAARIELEVEIDAPLESVWKTVVEEPDAWWVSDLRCVAGDSTVTLEPRAGGALIEKNDQGASLQWFTVLAIDPPRSLNLMGAIAPPFGGPCQTHVHVGLEARGEGTVVRFTNALHGVVSEDSLPDIERGWRLLLEKGLKAVAER